MSPESPSRDPIGEASDLVARTLRFIYAGFWFALAVYAILLLVVLPLTGTVATRRPVLPRDWAQWQLFFGITGIAFLYLSQRLRDRLVGPKRVYARLRPGSLGGAPPVMGALTQLMGRIVSGHVLLWCLVEVPALLGVLDRLLSGDVRYFAALLGMSALGLISHRPTRERVDRTFALLRATS
jgi:hypothetical protein